MWIENACTLIYAWSYFDKIQMNTLNIGNNEDLQMQMFHCKQQQYGISKKVTLHSVPECGSEALKCPKAPAHIWDLARWWKGL